MTDSKDYKEHLPETKSPDDAVVIDATAHRRSRIHGTEVDRGKGAVGVRFLADVPLKINVVLGESTMPLGEILALGTDSVVQLNKPSGEPVDIYVENQKLGAGEVLVLQEKLRVRVLEVTPVSVSVRETPINRPEKE